MIIDPKSHLSTATMYTTIILSHSCHVGSSSIVSSNQNEIFCVRPPTRSWCHSLYISRCLCSHCWTCTVHHYHQSSRSGRWCSTMASEPPRWVTVEQTPHHILGEHQLHHHHHHHHQLEHRSHNQSYSNDCFGSVLALALAVRDYWLRKFDLELKAALHVRGWLCASMTNDHDDVVDGDDHEYGDDYQQKGFNLTIITCSSSSSFFFFAFSWHNPTMALLGSAC